MDKDELAALDRAATQAIEEARMLADGDPDLLLVARLKQNEAFKRLANACALAYRTGKLVLIDDGAVERVWTALKDKCCSDPIKANRVVMVGRADIAAALAALGVK